MLRLSHKRPGRAAVFGALSRFTRAGLDGRRKRPVAFPRKAHLSSIVFLAPSKGFYTTERRGSTRLTSNAAKMQRALPTRNGEFHPNIVAR